MISSAIVSLSSRDDELFSPYHTTRMSDNKKFGDAHSGAGGGYAVDGAAAGERLNHPNFIPLEEENISVPALIALLILPHAWMLF